MTACDDYDHYYRTEKKRRPRRPEMRVDISSLLNFNDYENTDSNV
jgi:hypothetical protein